MNAAALRVVHVVPSIAPRRGGPSRSVPGLAGALLRQQVDSVLLTGRDAVMTQPDERDLPLITGARLPLPFEIPGPWLLAAMNRAVRGVDIVHVHSIWNGMSTAAAGLARRHRKLLVLSPRGMLNEENVQQHALFKRLYRRFIENANLAAVSGFHFLDETERQACQWIPAVRQRPSIVEPNGLGVAPIERRLEALPRGVVRASVDEPDARHMVFLGRLAAIKGLELQLELLADLRALGRRVHLHLIGPDHGEQARLQSLAARLGVSQWLHFRGPIYDDRRFQWLSEADAVLLTSHTECNAMTAAETLTASGVLVATDSCHLNVPGAAGAARVVARNRTSLRDAIVELLDSPAAAQSQREAARLYAEEHLDLNALAVQMAAFYRSLLAGAACAG